MAHCVAFNLSGSRSKRCSLSRWSLYQQSTLAEKGTLDRVIQAQVGHVDSQMMKTYSHIRPHALNAAATALEPEMIAANPEVGMSKTEGLIG